MEVNGIDGSVEEMRTMQGETIPLYKQILVAVLGSLYSCRQKKKSGYGDPFRR